MAEEVNNYLKLACEEAEKGVLSGDGGPFGAVVVQQGRVVAVAHNEVLKTNDPTAHAEVTAIRRAAAALGTFDLSSCVLYSSCQPCPMCYGAALWSRIDRLYYCLTDKDASMYGFDDSEFYDVIAGRKERSGFMVRVEVEGALNAMKMWSVKEDKIPY